MSPHVIRYVSALLVVALTTTGCGATFEEVRPDPEPIRPPPRSTARAASRPPEPWSGAFDDLDGVTLVAAPYAPRRLHPPEVTRQEFRDFMGDALRELDPAALRAARPSSPPRVIRALGKALQQRDVDITVEYQQWCSTSIDTGKCLDLSPDSPVLTDFQKYRVALEIALGHHWKGFFRELSDEARAALSPESLTRFLVGAMVSYMILLANPEPFFTKALAAATTAVVTAMLGARTLCDLVFGFVDMVRQVDAATSFRELVEAGQRYGQKIGASTARILMMAVTVLLNQSGGLARLLKFPKLPQGLTLLRAELGSPSALSIGQVSGVKVLQGGVYLAMAGAGAKVAGNIATVAVPTQSDANAPTPLAPAPSPITLPPGVIGYKSFNAFKAAMGPAGEGQAWHHIVEKCNEPTFGPEALHNPWNVIRLDAETHLKVSAHYSTKDPDVTQSQLTIRQWLRTQSYERQREYGLRYLKSLGVNIP